MEQLNIFVKEQLSRVGFKIITPNSTKCQHLKLLSEKFNFQIWELHCTNEVASGLLVFQTFMAAYSFCREGVHCPYLEFNNFWYESRNGKIDTQLLNDTNSALNEDCVAEIAKHLDVLGFADLFTVNPSDELIRIAKRRFSYLIINPSTIGNTFGLMNMCYVLHVLRDIVTNITVSLQSFRGGSRNNGVRKIKHCILHCLCNFTGPTLTSLTLQHFGNINDDENFRLLMAMLQQKNVVLHTE